MENAKMEAKHSVLMVPAHEAPVREMLLIAQALQESGRYECVFVIRWQCDQSLAQEIHANGFRVDCLAGTKAGGFAAKSQPEHRAGTWKRIQQNVLSRPKKFLRLARRPLLIDFLIRYRRQYRVCHSQLETAQKLFDRYGPAMAVMSGDRGVGLETAIIAQANRCGIPSLVIPWAVSSHGDVALGRRTEPKWKAKYLVRGIVKRLIATIYPQYCEEDQGQRLLYLPAECLLAARRLGMMPPNPWQPQGIAGLASHYALEGERVAEQAISWGVPPDKLTVSGRASSDRLYAYHREGAEYRNKVCVALGLDPAKKVVLCAVPQLAEHALCSWEVQQRETNFLFETLRACGQNVVLSLHPKSRLEHYLELAERHGTVIARDMAIEQLVPACDVFISAASSTVMMAAMCRKPIVVIDYVLKSGFAVFEQCPGATVVQDRGDLASTIQSALADTGAHPNDIGHAARETAPYSRFDGRSRRRLVDLVERLAAAPQRRTRRQAA